MKAMILAAGKGTRMLPLTERLPKPLLQAGDHSLIEHQVLKLRAAGFTELVINHAWHGEMLEAALGDGSRLGVDIHWSAEGEPLETAGGIHKALHLLGEDPFLVVNGDVWTDYPFASLRSAKHDNDLVHLVLVQNPPQHPGGDFILRDGARLAEKSAGQPTCTYSGIGVFDPQLFSSLEAGKHPLLPLLLAAIRSGRAGAEYFGGTWMDIGTPERLLSLDRLLKEGNKQGAAP
jgi:MurNAc alpha-1-phosphate uridylyltransferase